MFKEANTLTIKFRKKTAKSYHGILSWELSQLSYKKVYSFCYIISVKTCYSLSFAICGIFLPVLAL